MSLGRRATPRLRNVCAQRLTGPKTGIGGCPMLGPAARVAMGAYLRGEARLKQAFYTMDS